MDLGRRSAPPPPGEPDARDGRRAEGHQDDRRRLGDRGGGEPDGTTWPTLFSPRAWLKVELGAFRYLKDFVVEL
jgi:hypothetical protein